MKFVLSITILCIILVAVDYGDSLWGRRRRRRSGRRRRRWVKKTVKGVSKFYKKNKGWISAVLGLFGLGDSQSISNLALLKAYNSDSYDEFMLKFKDAYEAAYPNEDVKEAMKALDKIADTSLDELELFTHAEDINGEDVKPETALRMDLTSRVAQLNLLN